MPEAVKFIQDLAVIMIAAAAAGLLCRRIGLSPIVGYLVAGIIVGPHTPPRAFVIDPERVHLLAQLGLVFLMFGIGLGFSLRRLKQLGFPLLLATLGTAFIVFNMARLAAGPLGLDRVGSVFFAAMFVASSSAMIGKVLSDTGRSHEKSSQLAFGITLSEDIVAIVVLTLLGSYVRFGSEATAGQGSVIATLGLFIGFVLALITIGLLLVPGVLRRLSREASAELETIFVAGLLFGLSLMVVKAGYSIALGAFLLGAIIAETPQRAHVERAFSGLRDFFGAIFFVAIGMTIDVAEVPHATVPLLMAAAIAIFGRSIAAIVMLLMLGYDSRTSIRAGITLTPIGEFSFVIAQMATMNGFLASEYTVVAVGASLLTALISPALIKRNASIAEGLAQLRLPWLRKALLIHRRGLDALRQQSESSLLWRLTRKRFAQISVEMALVSAAMVFARPAIELVVKHAGELVFARASTRVVCWVVVGVVLLGPLIAIWRNIQAVALIFADYAGRSGALFARNQAVTIAGFRALSALGMVMWLWNFIPIEGGLWLTVGVIVFLALVAAFLWRRLVYWHSHMEISLETTLGEEGGRSLRTFNWMDRHAPWGLEISEIVLPDRFAFAGRSIGETEIRKRFGCTVIGIERQSFTLSNPGPTAHLFPGDRVLVLGTEEQVAATREHLLADRAEEKSDDTFRELALELVRIPRNSTACSRTLAELNWPRLLGVQVVGHDRDGRRTLTPAGDQRVLAGDGLLILGTPKQIQALELWLRPAAQETSSASAATPA